MAGQGAAVSGILQVLYSCHGCGVVDAKVTVRHRTEGQDVVEWVNDCGRLVSMDHARRSPACTTKKCDLKIPMAEGAGIGFASEEL